MSSSSLVAGEILPTDAIPLPTDTLPSSTATTQSDSSTTIITSSESTTGSGFDSITNASESTTSQDGVTASVVNLIPAPIPPSETTQGFPSDTEVTQSDTSVATAATASTILASSNDNKPQQIDASQYSQYMAQCYAYNMSTSQVDPTSYQQQWAAYMSNPYAYYQQQYPEPQQSSHAFFAGYAAQQSGSFSAEYQAQAATSQAKHQTQQFASQQSTSHTVEDEEVDDEDDDDPTIDRSGKKGGKTSNILPFWGNEKTMNLNPLILTNILQSPYFKVNLYALKTYHEVIDEIYYQVKHLEPWERGSRKVSGQTGMCGSVRGVGAGGIVSTPFCILYKLYTLKLTRKQLVGLLRHKDSPFIRALGFLYIRYTQPPNTMWNWFEPYLDDDEQVDVKAGVVMTIGELVRSLITKLDWYSTLFPRLPIPVQKDLEKKLKDYDRKKCGRDISEEDHEDGELDDDYIDASSVSRSKKRRSRTRSVERNRQNRSPNNRSRSYRSRSRSRSRERRNRYRGDRERDYENSHNGSKRDSRRRSRSRSRSPRERPNSNRHDYEDRRRGR